MTSPEPDAGLQQDHDDNAYVEEAAATPVLTPKEQLQSRIVALEARIAAGEAEGGEEMQKDRARKAEIVEATTILRMELIPINARIAKAEPAGLNGMRQALASAKAQMKKFDQAEAESQKLLGQIDTFMG